MTTSKTPPIIEAKGLSMSDEDDQFSFTAEDLRTQSDLDPMAYRSLSLEDFDFDDIPSPTRVRTEAQGYIDEMKRELETWKSLDVSQDFTNSHSNDRHIRASNYFVKVLKSILSDPLDEEASSSDLSGVEASSPHPPCFFSDASTPLGQKPWDSPHSVATSVGSSDKDTLSVKSDVLTTPSPRRLSLQASPSTRERNRLLFEERLSRERASRASSPPLRPRRNSDFISTPRNTRPTMVVSDPSLQRLEQCVQKNDHAYMRDKLDIEIFGSTSMNLILPGTSDVDVNVTLDAEPKDIYKNLGPNHKTKIINYIEYRVDKQPDERSHGRPGMKVSEVRAFARVPLIKVNFIMPLCIAEGRSETECSCQEPCEDFEILGDITLSHSIPRFNTKLVRAYSTYDSLVKRLMMMVKFWTHRRQIKDASQGYLSSYAWMMLVIFYCQQPSQKDGGSLLPNLQAPDRETLGRYGLDSLDQIKKRVPFSDTLGRARTLEVLEYPEIITPKDGPLDQMTASDHTLLLMGFLEWLGEVKWEKQSVSIRAGTFIPRPKAEASGHKKDKKGKEGTTLKGEESWRWSIEDPFEHFSSDCPRDLGCVLKREKVQLIRFEIARARKHFNRWALDTYTKVDPFDCSNIQSEHDLISYFERTGNRERDSIDVLRRVVQLQENPVVDTQMLDHPPPTSAEARRAYEKAAFARKYLEVFSCEPEAVDAASPSAVLPRTGSLEMNGNWLGYEEQLAEEGPKADSASESAPVPPPFQRNVGSRTTKHTARVPPTIFRTSSDSEVLSRPRRTSMHGQELIDDLFHNSTVPRPGDRVPLLFTQLSFGRAEEKPYASTPPMMGLNRGPHFENRGDVLPPPLFTPSVVGEVKQKDKGKVPPLRLLSNDSDTNLLNTKALKQVLGVN